MEIAKKILHIFIIRDWKGEIDCEGGAGRRPLILIGKVEGVRPRGLIFIIFLMIYR
jgi:hypothetical protein